MAVIDRTINSFVIILLCFLIFSCANQSDTTHTQLLPVSQECTEPRPQICTYDYTPVCATRDTGIRCVTSPCPGSQEQVTYSNACSACADTRVYSHTPGACE